MYLYEKYAYTFPGTNIHWITFSIIVIELVLLFYQVIYFLIRPSDKNRLWYLILLLLIIQYNIFGGLFVDPGLSVPLIVQYCLAYGSGILTSMYFPFYIYKFLNLPGLKFYAYYGSLFFLFLPFLLVFIVPYLITKNIEFSGKWVVLVPAIYAISLLYSLFKSVFKSIKKPDPDDVNYKGKVIGVCIAVVFWIFGLCVVTFLNGSQYIEHATTNMGFLIMTVIFVRSTVIDSRIEYKKLIKSENELQQTNFLLSQKIKERTKELELAVEQRTNTFISLAHEVRTPLTLVNNYLDQYIEKHGKSDEISIIKENIEILNNDVNIFFNEEMFLKGISPYHHDQIIHFSSFLSSKISAFKLYASKKDISLTEWIEEHIHIKADPEALHSIVNNLLENAIKYTPAKGSITVSLNIQSDKIVLSVKDTGYGIPENMYKKIFDPSFRINQNQTIKGMGMGLSILDNCVKSLSGKVMLKSEENIGSEFIVELIPHILTANDHVIALDVSRSFTKNMQMEEIEDAIGNPGYPSILLIEDNRDMLQFIRNNLKVHYNVYVAGNGKIASFKLKNIPTLDLIISDVMMAEMNGLMFLKIISDNPIYSHIPFLFLTANTTHENKYSGYSLGAIDYVQKPFRMDDLLLKIEAIIGHDKRQRNYIKQIAFSNLNALGASVKPSHDIQPGSGTGKFDVNCSLYGITKRERDIIALIEKALTYKEISLKLFISEKTVQKHCENIFSKVNVSNKLELLKKLQE
jgi:signal transduction histidine kinase/DNA-binding NarL/FixJ family response regulator